MSKELIVSSTSLETKVAIVEDDQVTEIFIERSKSRGILGNIYKGRVTKVLPGMQAAFVDIGFERHAFLYVSDFFEDFQEYEELFNRAEEEILGQEHRQEEARSGESRRSGRGRRKQSKAAEQRRDKAAEAANSETEVPTETLPATPLLSEGGSILPDRLNLRDLLYPGVETEKEPDSQRAGSEEASQGILPDHLQVVAKFEPEAPPDEELPDRQARVDTKRDVQKLAPGHSNDSLGRGKQKANSRAGNDQAFIDDLLRERQEILVQVAKEPIGKKGARITSHVALPGRYLVYMPTVDHVGVSRKIVSEEKRELLRDIVVKLRGDFGKGFIVRTAGANHDEQDFRHDMLYLTRLWEGIRVKGEKASAPALLHVEPSLVQRVIRDYFSRDFRAIRVDDEKEYERIIDFVSKFNSELVNRVGLFSKNTPIFDEFGVTAEIEKALKQKVWLKNGGYIVINQTEALVAIDVNTGKFVGNTNSLEDTITKTNLDAAKEVVRQIRLRDLGGIIVVDSSIWKSEKTGKGYWRPSSKVCRKIKLPRTSFRLTSLAW